jgi:polysaccharide biosynthesis/export protein
MKYLTGKSSWIRVVAFILIPLFNLINPSTVLSLDVNMPPGKSIVPRVSEYIIGPEDVLDISVWKNTELSKTVTVRPDGMISLPLIGDIKAAELTPDKLRNAIAVKLKEYQNEAVVSVILHETNSNKVFILGEVAKQGTYILKRKTTFLQAIALAGGFTQFASKKKIVVVRQKADDGKEEKMLVSFDDIIDINSKSDQNIILRPGDTIFVP